MNKDGDGCMLTVTLFILLVVAILIGTAIRVSASETKGLNHHLAGVDEDMVCAMLEKYSHEADEENSENADDNGQRSEEFIITGYCSCEICCGKSDGITASGTQATAGRTIAVDPTVIPLGTTVVIDENIYIAEDTGAAIKGNRIDIYFDSHDEALEWGVQEMEVCICNR